MPARSPQLVSRAVAGLILLVSLVYVAEPVSYGLGRGPSAPALLLAAVGVSAFVTTFVRTVWDVVAEGAGRDRHLLDLAVCGSAAFALCLSLGLPWAALPSLFAGAAAVALSPVRSVVVVVLTLAGVAFAGLALAASPGDVVDLTARSAVTVLVLGGLGWLATFAEQTHRQRAELARMAVVEERMRFARDLHDVLGHSLSVIGLKNEVALLLVHAEPDKAARELQEALEVSRRAVADLRTLVRGYRRPSLAAEVEGVRSVLELAGVRCEADAVPSDLPARAQDVAGWVVREGGTNVLRHSKATCCRIRVQVSDGQLVVALSNDNPRRSGAGEVGSEPGTGLAGLAERVAAVGGALTWGTDGDEVFRLRASVPLSGRASSRPRDDGGGGAWPSGW